MEYILSFGRKAMEKNLDDFINDWQVDLKNKSAQHKSGLRVAYDADNEDGSIRVATSGMSTFLKTTYAELQDVTAVNQKYRELTEQFAEIYRVQMKAPVQNTPQQNTPTRPSFPREP